MHNNKNKFFLVVLAISFSVLSVNAAYYYDDGQNEDNPNVDKFRPTSGVKIKESNIASWMEKTTRNAMDGTKTPNTQQKSKKINNETYVKTYKWF